MKTAIASALTALAASVCCVGPVVAVTMQSGVEAEVIKSEAPAEVSRAALKVDGLPRRGKHL